MDDMRWSTPDYESWELPPEVAKLPTRKFIFFVSVAALVVIACSLVGAGEHAWAAFVATLVPVFGTTSLLMQGRKGGNGRSDEDENEEIESPTQPLPGGAVEVARRTDGRSQHDGSGVEGSSSL